MGLEFDKPKDGYAYSANILHDLQKPKGLYNDNKPLYFIYNKSIFENKDALDLFDRLIQKRSVMCITTGLEKSHLFYKKYFPSIIMEKKVSDNSLSVMYQLYYKKKDFVAAAVINLVLQGRIKPDQIQKIYLLKRLDKSFLPC
jgi:hypothetical protein|nr:MAG TPA: hypothetical protein [Caudoviricetes sp.]